MRSLSAVIPAHNDERPLRALLAQAAVLGLFERVIVIDDGSDPPLPDDLAPAGARAGWLEVHRREVAGGPGPARNLGAAIAGGSHVVFLDADDAITPDLAALWAETRDLDFDFCLFRHADSRVTRYGLWGQSAHDEGYWIAAGLHRHRLGQADRGAAAYLAQTANYPWNKIYRRDFLAHHAIACADLPVHEDIRLHWGSFLAARTVLTSNRVAVQHRVGDPSRLSGWRGRERLAVFAALDEVSDWIAADSNWFAPWAAFSSRLFDWVEGTLDPAYHGEFHRRRRAFLTGLVPPAAFAGLVRARPLVARRIVRQLA